ncbi:MAG: filamentous hemagglutinin N-terminal domain-containing protein [Candidatus Sedimenticola endophacoides]
MFSVERQLFNWRQSRKNGAEVNLFTRMLVGGLIVVAATGGALAAPTGGVVRQGVATIEHSSGPDVTTITQTSDLVRIDWGGFDTDATQSVTFVQPRELSVAINRIAGDPTDFLGTLSANGRVFLINNSGITFGASAQVNVGALVATVSDIDVDAMNGQFDVSSKGGDPYGDGHLTDDLTIPLIGRGIANGASVENHGTIKTTSSVSGFAVLAAPNVINEGVIKAEMGTVGLVSGADGILVFRFEEGGEGLIGYEATAGSLPDDWEGAAQVVQGAKGSVSGRSVYITAHMANNLREGIINLSGVVDATVLDTDGNLVNTDFDKAYAEVRADGGNVHLDGARITAEAAGCADVDLMGCATVVINAKERFGIDSVEVEYVPLPATDGNLADTDDSNAYTEVQAVDGAPVSADAVGCADTDPMGCATVVIEAMDRSESNNVEYVTFEPDNVDYVPLPDEVVSQSPLVSVEVEYLYRSGGVIDGGRANSIRATSATSHSAAGEDTKATVLIGADRTIDLVLGGDGDAGLSAFASGFGRSEADVYIGDYEGERFLGEGSQAALLVGENLSNGESAPDVTLRGSVASLAVGGDAEVRASFNVEGYAVDFTEDAVLDVLAMTQKLSGNFIGTVDAVAEFRAENDLDISGDVAVDAISSDAGDGGYGVAVLNACVTADSEVGDVEISGGVTVRSAWSSQPSVYSGSYASLGVSAGGGIALSGPVEVDAQAITACGSTTDAGSTIDTASVVEVEADEAVTVAGDIVVNATSSGSLNPGNRASAFSMLRMDGRSVSVSEESEQSVQAYGLGNRGEESHGSAEANAELIAEESIVFEGTLGVTANAKGNSVMGVSPSGDGYYWAPVMAKGSILLDGSAVTGNRKEALAANVKASNASVRSSTAIDIEVELLGEKFGVVGAMDTGRLSMLTDRVNWWGRPEEGVCRLESDAIDKAVW